MNDLEFSEWAEKLIEFRNARKNFLSSELREKKSAFTCANFFQLAVRSLGEIVDTWWTFEQNPMKKEGLDSARLSLLHNEVEHLIDFELSALEKDLEYALNQVPWDQSDVDSEKRELIQYANQLKSSYKIKIDSLLLTKKTDDPEKLSAIGSAPTYRSMSNNSTSTSTLAIGTMFLVGLLLGGGASFYFWDSFRKSEQNLQQELDQLRTKNKELEDSFNIYQQSYIDLAHGKSKTIPQLEASILERSKRFKEKRLDINLDFAEQKAAALRKTSGLQQKRLIDSIEENRLDVLAELDSKEKMEIEPLKKQLDLLKQLTGVQ